MPITALSKAVRWEKTKEIFEAALNLTGTARAAYVRKAASGDSGLEADVEKLLAADEQVGSFLDSPWTIGEQTAAEAEMPPQFREGDMVSGRFRVRRLLGHGGMGQVYEAEDVELGVPVALKTIRPEIASNPEVLARFRQEVRLARRITHPNVCRTFDMQREVRPADSPAGQATEVTYLTMEYLPGETLRDVLKQRGRLATAEALGIARQMASALTAAHETGVVHRDIKPANVMIVPRVEGDRVVITDFGLARFDARDGQGDLSLISQSGRMIGTLAYMAPEQIEGGGTTAATDIYAFGLVLYEMVTGAKAFPETSLLGGAWKRLGGPPASPKTLVGDLSEAWVRTILRCLQVRPENRFASAAEVVASLAEGMPSRASSAKSTRYSPVQGYAGDAIAGQPGRWRRWALAGAAFAVVVSLLAAGLRFYGIRPDAKVAPGAIVFLAGIRNETGERSLDNLTELMRGQLAQSAQFNLLDRGTVADMLRRMTKDPNTSMDATTAREIAMRAGAARVVMGSVSRSGTQYTLKLHIDQPDNRPDRARHSVPNQWSWQADQAGEQPGEIPAAVLDAIRDSGAWVRSKVGEAGNDVARLDAPPQDVTTSSWDALAEYTNAQALASRNEDEGAVLALRKAVRLDPGFALAYARLGDLLVADEHTVEGYEAYEKALSTGLERRLSRRERDRIKGMYALDSGDLEAADLAFHDYIDYYENDPLGWAYRVYPLKMLGRTDEAIAALRRDLELRPKWKFAMTELVRSLMFAGRLDEARKALGQLREAGFVDDANELEGSLEFLTGKLDEADVTFGAMSQAKDPVLRWKGLRLQARVAAERGDDARALKLLEAVTSVDPGMQPALLLERASVRSRLGEYAAMRTEVQQALKTKPSPQSVIAASNVLGEALERAPSGERRAARDELEALPATLPQGGSGMIFELARLRVQGEILLARSDWNGAVAVFRRAATVDAPVGSREYLGRALAAAALHQRDPVLAQQMRIEAMQAYGAVALRPGFVLQDPLAQSPGFYAEEAGEYLRLALKTGPEKTEMRTAAEAFRRLRKEQFVAIPGLQDFLKANVAHAEEPITH